MILAQGRLRIDKMDVKTAIGYYLYGGFMAFQCGIYLANDAHKEDNLIPKVEHVQSEYIAPSKLEIKCEDLDGDSKLETVMKINGKQYLLKNVNGRPTLLEYKAKPSEKYVRK